MAAKTSTRHPYAAIEHRVIDSLAYASLTFSARSLLVLLTRQLAKDNNGRMQATYTYLRRFGFDSERTISRCLKELIAHGFVYRTRCGGYQQGASLYAVTWIAIKNRDGLFLDGFKPCAWRDWKPDEKKTPPAKMQVTHGKNGILTPVAHAKNAGDTPRKNADIELMPCSSTDVRGLGLSEACQKAHAPKLGDWIPGYLGRLAARGLADACPVATIH